MSGIVMSVGVKVSYPQGKKAVDNFANLRQFASGGHHHTTGKKIGLALRLGFPSHTSNNALVHLQTRIAFGAKGVASSDYVITRLAGVAV